MKRRIRTLCDVHLIVYTRWWCSFFLLPCFLLPCFLFPSSFFRVSVFPSFLVMMWQMHVFKDEKTGAYEVHDEIDVIRGFPRRVEGALKGALRRLEAGARTHYADYRATKALKEAKRRAMCGTHTHPASRRVWRSRRGRHGTACRHVAVTRGC